VSTILKALRRLEREKQPEPGKALRDEVVAFLPGEPQEPHSDRRLWWAVAGGVAILVLGLLWVASGEREREAGARSAVVPAPRPEAIAPAPAPAEEAPAVPAPVAEMPSPRTPSTPHPAPEAREPTSSPAVARLDEPSSGAGARAPERAEPKARPYRLPDREPLQAFVAPVPAPVPEAAPPAEAVGRAAEPAAPQAPEAHVESTTWHPDPSRRRAVVSAEGRAAVTLREGDAIGELVVLRVDPSGVVFLYQGREITRRVGK
jgi:hypothetical protein